jgi:hypothetical protein
MHKPQTKPNTAVAKTTNGKSGMLEIPIGKKLLYTYRK